MAPTQALSASAAPKSSGHSAAFRQMLMPWQPGSVSPSAQTSLLSARPCRPGLKSWQVHPHSLLVGI